jgi:hypothetical protein
VNINAIAGLKGEPFRFIRLTLAEDNLQKYVESHHLGFPVCKSFSPELIQRLRLAGTPQPIVGPPDGTFLKKWVGAFSALTQPEVEEFLRPASRPDCTAKLNTQGQPFSNHYAFTRTTSYCARYSGPFQAKKGTLIFPRRLQ